MDGENIVGLVSHDTELAETLQDTSTPRVLVVQSGGRHNYALPEIFADVGILEAFYTDICGGSGIGRVASLSHLLPSSGIRRAMERLSHRRPSHDVLSRTKTDGWNTLRHISEDYFSGTLEARFRNQVRFDGRHGQRMAQWGLGRATHLFNTLGEGAELSERAHDQGLPVYSDIIIALSADRIVREEFAAYPEWGPPPILPGSSPERPGIVGPLLEFTSTFVCPSQFVLDDLVTNWGVAPERTRIVPYSLSKSWFSIEPEPIPGRVLFVGSADRRKGIHYLAAAADILHSRGRTYEFRILGHVDQSVRDQPLARHLSFQNRVPRNLVAEEFAKADILVLPSLAEGSATVTYEALASGVPVVTTPNSGSPVRQGIDGFIVPIRNPDALANSIESIVEDRELRARMSNEAIAGSRCFTWERYANALCALFYDAGSESISNRGSQ